MWKMQAALYWDAEFLRLKGEILLAQDPAAGEEAESLFLRVSVLFIPPQGFGPVLAVAESHHSGCFLPLVTMLKATDSRPSDDLGIHGWSSLRSAPGGPVAKASVDSIVVVVVDVLANESPQLPLVDHDHVVKQLATNGADPALRDSVLPRTSMGRPLWVDPEIADRLGHTS
jgi:hypothetical protein